MLGYKVVVVFVFANIVKFHSQDFCFIIGLYMLGIFKYELVFGDSKVKEVIAS